MTIKSRSQPLLVKEMGDQTDAPAKDEKAIQYSHPQVVLCFFGREGTAVSQEVDEANGNTAIHIEDQVVFLGSGDCLDG